MPNKTIRLSALIATLLCCGTATAQEFSEQLLQKVESDYTAMMPMTRDERRAYWDAEVNALSRDERLQYQRAYKSLAPTFPTMPAATGESGTSPSSTRVPGTGITYDNGVALGTTVVQSSFAFANLFDSGVDAVGGGAAIEPVETTGSITQVEFSILTGTDNVFFSVFSNIVGTAASVVTSANIPSTTGLNTFTPAPAIAYANGPFIAGVWFIAGDTLQGSTGTVNGQGFHGVSINDIVGTGLNTMVTTGGGSRVNAIFRVSGNVLQQTVPVELMDFTIED